MLRAGLRSVLLANQLSVVLHTEKTKDEQKGLLRAVIQGHEEKVQLNKARKDATSSTYDPYTCTVFPCYNLATLPVTTGVHRGDVREGLKHQDILPRLQRSFLCTWEETGERRAIVFGCKSVHYLQRILSREETHSYLVVDNSLKVLANAAAVLVPQFGSRIHFLRCEAMFTCLEVVPPTSADVVVAPMPTPFWSGQGSHRRLVNHIFLCACHRLLKERSSPDDARGFIAFTDAEPYAEFMMEELEAARIVVPWTRKDPKGPYALWLPVPEKERRKEFTQQRFADIVAIAASKSGPLTPQALQVITSYDYKRTYYRPLRGEDPGTHE